LSSSRYIYIVRGKRIESLPKISGMKFEFKNLEIRFHKRKVSFRSSKPFSVERH